MWFQRNLSAGIVLLGVCTIASAQQPAAQNAGPATGAAAAPNANANALPSATPTNTGIDGAMTGSFFLRATQVVGVEVRESTGQARIGQVADLLLTPTTNSAATAGINTGAAATTGIDLGIGANGVPANVTGPRAGIGGNATTWWHSQNDVRFALIQIDNATGDRVVVIPWELLSFQGAYFVMVIPETRLAEAPSVMLNDPRILQDAQWLDQVGTFFGADLQHLRGQTGLEGAAGAGVTAPIVPQPGVPAVTPPATDRPASRTTAPPRSTRRGAGAP